MNDGDKALLKDMIRQFGSKTGQSAALSGLSLNAHAWGNTDKGSELGERADKAQADAETLYAAIMRTVDEL